MTVFLNQPNETHHFSVYCACRASPRTSATSCWKASPSARSLHSCHCWATQFPGGMYSSNPYWLMLQGFLFFQNIKNITSVLNTFLDRMEINHPITFTRWSFMIGCNDRRGALTEIPCYHAARSLAFQTVSVLPQIRLCCYTVCGSTFESIPGFCSDATTLPHPCCDNQTHLQILSLIPGGKTPSSWLLLYRAWYQLCGR